VITPWFSVIKNYLIKRKRLFSLGELQYIHMSVINPRNKPSGLCRQLHTMTVRTFDRSLCPEGAAMYTRSTTKPQIRYSATTRVTTNCLENLEMTRNLTNVRKVTRRQKSLGKDLVREICLLLSLHLWLNQYLVYLLQTSYIACLSISLVSKSSGTFL